MSSEKILCSKCFNNIQKNFAIICEICNCKFHKVCAKIENESAVNALFNFENIVYNCDNCLQSSCDLVKKVSLLTYEIEQMKTLFSQFMNNNSNNNNMKPVSHRSLPVLKTGFNSNASAPCLEKTNCHNTLCSYSQAKDNNTAFAANRSAGNLIQTTAVNSVDVNADVAVKHVDDNANVAVLNDDNLIDADDISSWSNVTRRKIRTRKHKVVVGDNDNSELDVVIKMKWVHLSSFKPSVTEDNIISYVEKHLDIGKSNISCYKLIKKDVETKDLRFINFKLGVSSVFYEQLFKPELWTADIKVRPFKFFPKKPTLERQI